MTGTKQQARLMEAAMKPLTAAENGLFETDAGRQMARGTIAVIDWLCEGWPTSMNDIFRDLREEREAAAPTAEPRYGNGWRKQMRTAIIARDGIDCWLCGKVCDLHDRTVEHLTELAQGGTNDIDNLALAHHACNQRMNGLTLAQKHKLRAEVRS